MKGKFLVLKSSAGSGKTYSLVNFYLQLALSSNEPFYYSHILAITFTNAAAAEMKERIISRLREFSTPESLAAGDTEMFEHIRSVIGTDAAELHSRAQKTLAHILHNYSRFSVQTIDSFTHRIIRSFARDLRLSPDFEIEMDSNLFLEQVVDNCLNEIGRNKELTKYLERFVLDNFEEESNWNIRLSLLEFAKVLVREDSEKALIELQKLSLGDIAGIRDSLYEKNRAYEYSIESEAIKILNLLHSNGIEVDDLAYGKGGAMGYLHRLAEGDKYEAPGKRLYDYIEKGWAKKNSPKEGLIRSLQDELNKSANTIIALTTGEGMVRYQIAGIILKNIYSLGVLTHLAHIAAQLKEDQNIVLISDFQKKISQVVNGSSAPFIYERVGERYNHILIDEFQDTSELQWQNFIPLIENALSHGNFNLIVGDGKQAIYRWRNGNSDQFIRLPEIPEGPETLGRKNLFISAYDEQLLNRNYRSSRTIIQFNNDLYNILGAGDTGLSEVYSGQEQHPVRNREGYVHVYKTEGADKNEWRENTFNAILNSIHDSLEAGYAYGDIAILTRKGAREGGVIAEMLSGHGIRAVTQDSFLLVNSPKVRLVMAVLSWLATPSDTFRSFEIFNQSSSLMPDRFPFEETIGTFSVSDGYKAGFDAVGFLHQNFPEIASLRAESENAYTLAEKCISSFAMESDVYLEFLLEHLVKLSYDKELTLPLIVTWWEEQREKLYVISSPDPQAVKIMTIHKSKGLQFPVVIYPRFSGRGRESDIWVRMEDEDYGLPYLFTKYKPDFATEQFPREFTEERDKKAIDELNLCYVATTRAEERMYVVLEFGRDTSPLTKKIEDVLNRIQNTSNTEWVFGRAEKAILKTTDQPFLTEVIHPKPSEKKNIRIRTNPFRKDIVRQQRIETGDLVHECLSYIYSSKDIDAAIDKIQKNHLQLTPSDIRELRDTVREVVSASAFAQWFSGEFNILNETEIISPDGSVQRPDRVLISEKEIIVIDFKTGATSKSHLSQVSIYMSLLRQMFQQPVKGYLAYTRDMSLQPVEQPGLF